MHHKKEIKGPRPQVCSECRFLLATPRLLRIVRILSLELELELEMLFHRASHGHAIPSFLERVPNLHTLSVTVRKWQRDSDTSLSCGQLLAKCTFQLRNLSCEFDMNLQFITFLAGQPSITTLDWCPSSKFSHHMPPNLLPNLGTIVLWQPILSQLMTELVTGRPVTHVSLHSPDMDISSAFLRCLPFSASSIRSLSIRPYFLGGILDTLPDFLPNLEYLGAVPCWESPKSKVMWSA
jgi:hypothetical protein